MKAGDKAIANGRSVTVRGLRDGGLVVLEMEDGSVVIAMEEYREITDRLQQCVQRHRLGLGGERIDALVCDEVDRLRAAHQEQDANDYPAWFAQLARVTVVICWRCRSVEYVENDYFALGKATCDGCGEKTYALPAVFRPKERDADARRLDVFRQALHRIAYDCDNGEHTGIARAAIDAAMAPDTQTEGESDGPV